MTATALLRTRPIAETDTGWRVRSPIVTPIRSSRARISASRAPGRRFGCAPRSEATGSGACLAPTAVRSLADRFGTDRAVGLEAGDDLGRDRSAEERFDLA
jgi:hypothetical protein